MRKIIYNKLVRDKIIEIIENKGKEATYSVLNENDFERELISVCL